MTGPFCAPHSICLLKLVSDMAVLYGNDAFSSLVLSTKKVYFSFFYKDFCYPENLFQSQGIENGQNLR